MAFVPPSAKHLERSVRTQCPECGTEFRVCSQCGSVIEGPWEASEEEKEVVEKVKELRGKNFGVFIRPKG